MQAVFGDYAHALCQAALINVVTGHVAFLGTETFSGGTGRFAGATGSADFEGTASIFTNVGFFTTGGRIRY